MTALAPWALIIIAGLSPVTSQSDCGGNLTLTEGQWVEITSPLYPDPYPNNVFCLWKIHATDLSQVIINCPQVDLQSNLFGCVDTIAFSDAENFNQLPSYCKNRPPPDDLGFGDSVFIRFESDALISDAGFVCNVTAQKQEVDIDCECGMANTNSEFGRKHGKIWEGEPVFKHEFPWLALLTNLDSIPRVLCGATVINSHYLLTSGRCVMGMSPGDFRVRVGEHDLMNNNESPPHKIHEVEKIVVHPAFNISNMQYDLALLRTAEQMLFETNVRPACMPEGVMDLGQTQVLVAGWGSTGPSGTQEDMPLQAFLDVEPPTAESCNALMPPELPVFEGQICTTSLDGADVCTGDFGGPVVQEIDGIYYLVAISSYNTECANFNVPTIHSRIDYHSAWILGESSDALHCNKPELP